MESRSATYKQLFLSTFKLSACTFGGGFVIVPLMKKRFVEELGWVEEDEMLDFIAIAQSAPGPIAVSASLLLGFHVAGIPGALLTVLGTVLPPLGIISVISLFYDAFRSNALVNMAMAGMLCGVAAVILDVVIRMISTVLRQKRLLPCVLLLGAFAAVSLLSVHIFVLMLICGLIGAADSWYRSRAGKGGDGK